MTTQPHRHFDADRFRHQHKPEIVEPLRDGGQQRIDGRCRVIVRGPAGLVAYDSQKEHGESGIFTDKAEALDHGIAWIDAVVRRENRREQLEADRRFALADIEAASQKREADLRAQRKDLTQAINKERKIQAALAAEARDPKVKIEFGGGSVFEVIDEPSVFDGTLDADGRPIAKPAKPRRSTTTTPPDGPPPPVPPPAAVDPVQANRVTALADRHNNGNAKQGEVVERLEGYQTKLERSTLAAVALGEWGRKKRRAALDEFLRFRKIPLDDRDALLGLIDASNPEADFAAAAMVTSTSTSSGDLTEWLGKILDPGVLEWARGREESRSRPRPKLIALIDERIKAADAYGWDDDAGGDAA